MATDGQRFPAPGSAGHHDLDTLALLDADALEPAVAADVRGHLATCVECRATLATLGSVRAALADLPAPRVPPAVAATLDAALAAERQARFGVPASPEFGPRAGLGDLAVARHRRRRHTVLGWAAAAVVLLGGIGTGTALIASPGSSDSHPQAAPTHPSRTTFGPAAPSGPAGQLGVTDQTQGPTAPGPNLVPGGRATPNALIPRYTRDDINASLGMIIAQANCDASGSCGAGSAGAMSDRDRRARCLSALRDTTGVRGTPEAVQFALFEGKPAFVFVFAGGRVLVVDTGCGQSGSPDVLFSGP